MRFDLTDDQELMRDTARRFLEKEAPIAATRKHYGAPQAYSREIWRKACEIGWASLAASEEAGGYSLSGKMGQDLAVVAEEAGRLIAPGYFAPVAVSLQALAQSEALLGEWAPDVLGGETILAWAFGEPGNCWEPAAFKVEAARSGEDIRLNGVKAYVEGGDEAKAFVVTARSEGGLTQLLVAADHPGVTVVPARSVDFSRRFAEVRFEDVRLPASAVLGAFAGADAAVERQLQLALLLQCAETNGALEQAYAFTIDYMRQRYAFGRPIASYQALKHRLADMLLELHSCMATTDAALDAYDVGSPEAPRLARIAKAYVATKSVHIMGELVQM
ncbi:MAG: acyl-CoA/acyl-ACP dehydrogenase, partial [Caulobacteraceae bacterium]|nr:acyl-CoA/acyl-ACP dehydrogenase [Caulobacteraceae bacterium]